MLGKFLEGAAWFAALSLATTGGLIFVPDGAWESFPPALRSARATLAEFGVAPTCYRADFDASEQNANGDKVGENGENGETVVGAEDAWLASTEIRIGERWVEAREVGETAFVGVQNGSVASGLDAGNRTRQGSAASETFAIPDVGETEEGETAIGANVPSFWGEANDVDAPLGSANDANDDENWGTDAIPPFVVEGLPLPESAGNATAEDVALDVANAETGAAPVGEDVAALGEPANANGFSDESGFNATPGVSAGLLEQADAALANELGVESSVGNAASVDEETELRDALTAASTASTPEAIKTVFEALNRIRDERGARLAAEDAKALDRLAFEVFYNPEQTILEPRWQTAPGESLASIAERLGTTPETLAEINGIRTPLGEPLPVGTTLKTVRGPASAEISIAKKELTFRFNGLYAGRFALGVPEGLANMRGVFRVVEKLANPNCDAVDANGQTIAIPGGAPENPLGVAWIALDGGVGLQGTNRPELVGQTIAENGGFVFSNQEISQLSVLLPVGAEVAIVE